MTYEIHIDRKIYNPVFWPIGRCGVKHTSQARVPGMAGAEELNLALQKVGSETSSERQSEGEKRTSIMRLRLDKARGHMRCWRGLGGLFVRGGAKEEGAGICERSSANINRRIQRTLQHT